MIGIVIVTHGHLGDEFVKALQHIMGPQEALSSVSVDADSCMEGCRELILDHIKAADQGKGVVLLTDMFGGTPSNLALSLLEHANVEIIAGVNLPLLVKLASVRKNKTLHQAVLESQEAGQKYIHVASNLLEGDAQKHG